MTGVADEDENETGVYHVRAPSLVLRRTYDVVEMLGFCGWARQ